jgi:di/tricarboxylate transporter
MFQAQQGNPVNKALGWLVLAWSSTVAGNLTLVGSIANLIVAERAAQAGHEITFWNHLKFASWSTLIIIGAGDLILYYFVRPWIEAKLGNEIHQGIALGNGSGFDDVDAYANLTGTGSLSGL